MGYSKRQTSYKRRPLKVVFEIEIIIYKRICVIKITLNRFELFRKIRKPRCTTGINDNGSKFAAGVNYTGGKFVTGINDTGVNLSCNRYQRHRCQFFQRYCWCR
jgi:hypothetical protein